MLLFLPKIRNFAERKLKVAQRKKSHVQRAHQAQAGSAWPITGGVKGFAPTHSR
jgi:hypothetical protein